MLSALMARARDWWPRQHVDTIARQLVMLYSSNSGASSSSVPYRPLPSIPISSQSGTSSIPGSLSRSASDAAAEYSTTFCGTNSTSLNL